MPFFFFLTGILYQIKRVELSDGSFIYCLWISRDPEELGEGTKTCHFGSSLTIASSAHLTADLSLGKVNRQTDGRGEVTEIDRL